MITLIYYKFIFRRKKEMLNCCQDTTIEVATENQ